MPLESKLLFRYVNGMVTDFVVYTFPWVGDSCVCVCVLYVPSLPQPSGHLPNKCYPVKQFLF